MQTAIIFSQILALSVLVIIGIGGAKLKVITRETNNVLAGFIFNVTLPFMLFVNFFKIELTPRILTNSLLALGLTLCVLVMGLVSAWLWTRLIRMKQGDKVIFWAHTVFGNIIYLGFPLISALYGSEGLLYASMFQVVSYILLWTVGVIILHHGNGSSVRQNLKHIINPNTLAVFAGFAMFLFSVRLPPFLVKSLGGLGDSTSYLAMIYIGAMLYHTRMKGMFYNKIVYLLSMNKLILVPFILCLFFEGLDRTGILKTDPLVISVLILQASMPCMVNVVIMAKNFGADDQLAAKNVFISTLLSVVTLPLVLLMIEQIT